MHLQRLFNQEFSVNPKYLRTHTKTISTFISLQEPISAELYRVQSQACVCAAMTTHTQTKHQCCCPVQWALSTERPFVLLERN